MNEEIKKIISKAEDFFDDVEYLFTTQADRNIVFTQLFYVQFPIETYVSMWYKFIY